MRKQQRAKWLSYLKIQWEKIVDQTCVSEFSYWGIVTHDEKCEPTLIGPSSYQETCIDTVRKYDSM